MSALLLEPDLIRRLRKDLVATRFFVDDVNALFGEVAANALLRNERVPALLAARGGQGDLSVLARLFVLWDEVSTAEVARALPTVGVDGLVRLGLVEEREEKVRGLVQLQPHEAVTSQAEFNWWIASDLGEGLTGTAPRRDHVLGIGGATRALLQLTPRDRVDSVLDLGTGCGVLAMYATTHANRVVATDLSGRALDFARFNFALNELDIETREGSLYDPVEGEQFDLIMSNPPFVITPDSLRGAGLVEYRDGGRKGDDLMKEVVTRAADHLKPDGRALLLGNWEISGQWDSHPRAWLEAAGLNGWVVQREQLDPAQYVEMWMRDNGARLAMSPAEYEEAFALWIADFERRGVQAVGLGMVALERGSQTPSIVCEQVVTSQSASGDYIGSAMSEIFRFEIAPKTSENAVFVRESDVREERHYEPGATDPQVIVATQGGGFGRRIQLNSWMAAALGACDGELAIGQIISALHVLTDEDRDVISKHVYSQLGLLVRAGMLKRMAT